MQRLTGVSKFLLVWIALLLAAGSSLAQSFTVQVTSTYYDPEKDECCYNIRINKGKTLAANMIIAYVDGAQIMLGGNVFAPLHLATSDWEEYFITGTICVKGDGNDKQLLISLGKWTDVPVYTTETVASESILLNCGSSKCCTKDATLFKRELISNDDGSCCSRLTLLKKNKCDLQEVALVGSTETLDNVGEQLVICDEEASIVFYNTNTEGTGSVCKVALADIPVDVTIPTKQELACCALGFPKLEIIGQSGFVSMLKSSGGDLKCDYVGLEAFLDCGEGPRGLLGGTYGPGDVIPKDGSYSSGPVDGRPMFFLGRPPLPELSNVHCKVCLKFKVKSTSCRNKLVDCEKEVCYRLEWTPDGRFSPYSAPGMGTWTLFSLGKANLDDEGSLDQTCRISEADKDGRLTVEVTLSEPSIVVVYSLLGQPVQSYTLAPSSITREIQLPQSGVFLVRIETASGEGASKVVVYSE